MAEHINGPLHWEQLGKFGRPMVFVHPNPMDRSCWLYQMAHFSTWFRTIGIDLPGYGRSPSAVPGLTMPDVAQACWEAVDEVTDDPAILVGESVGHTVALYMANQQPQRTLAVILMGAGFSQTKTGIRRRPGQYEELGVGFRYQHALEDFSPAFRETEMGKYFARMFSERNRWADVGTIITMFRALGEPDPDWLQSGVEAPTLIVSGSLDNAHATVRELQQRIVGSELVTIQDAGHACNMEKPWEVDAAMLDFLGRHGLVDVEAGAAAV